jgi:formylmethanofuran dehydrogenase subunit B
MSTPAGHTNVVCPFCSLLCDDLVVEQDGTSLRVAANGCPRSIPLFAVPVPNDVQPLVAGQMSTYDEAVERAAAILRQARAPLLAGLGTDTAGIRAALAVAELTGGSLDHVHGRGLSANLSALQTGGWVTATLAEARNRPDFVLLVGGYGRDVAPRLFDRILRPPRTLDSSGPPARRIVQLGGDPPSDRAVEHQPCPADRLLGTVGLLRALTAGRPVRAEARLVELAGALAGANYALIVWAVGELPDAEPIGAHLADMSKSLNLKERAAGLPLAGPDNVIGANQTAAWQTGVPLPLALAQSVPDYDPVGWSGDLLIERGSVDALIWISTLSDIEPPATDVPTIMLARAGFQPARPMDVLIPAGVPGLDHAGSLYRTDGVVALPVRKLRNTGLPSVAELLGRIARAVAA